MNIRQRLANWLAPEARATDPSWAGLQAITGPGVAVSARAAENIAAVHACVSAISSAIASLPAYVHRITGDARKELADHPLAMLIRHGANSHQTWPDFIESMVASVLLQGNALAAVERDAQGQLTALRFIPWGYATASMLPSGRLAYDICEQSGHMGNVGRRYRLLEGECIHLKDRSDDGLVGRSRLSRCAGAVQTALETNEHARNTFVNAARPLGALKTPQFLNPEQVSQVRDAFDSAHVGSANAGKTLLLQGGLDWQAISVTPEDAELLASRKFSVEEIARVFQVPPPLIQDLSHGTFTNSREAARWFAQFTLAPWANKIEREIGRALFDPESQLALELDLSGLLRGDPETRWQSHKIAVEAGILTPNEVREVEGYGPVKSAPENA
jgi:HK97 family phage portal protein